MNMATVEEMKAELKAKSDGDALGFRKEAAWDAIFAADDLAALRQRLSADDIKRLMAVVVPAAVNAHDWFTYGRLNWECCRACGIVRRKDGQNSPCKGAVRVGPRGQADILPNLWNAIIENTRHESAFWLGEMLLSEIKKETGYAGPAPCANPAVTSTESRPST